MNNRVALGKSGLYVDRLCVGLEAIHAGHAHPVLCAAVDHGAMWWDLEDKRHAAAVRQVLLDQGRDDFVLSVHADTRAYDETRNALASWQAALQVDMLDIVFIGDVRDGADLAAREQALTALRAAKAEGAVRAVGVITGDARVLNRLHAEGGCDVVMAVWNDRMRLLENRANDEIAAMLRHLHDDGMGIVLTRVPRHTDPVHMIRTLLAQPFTDAIRLTPASVAELSVLAHLVDGDPVSLEQLAFLRKRAA